MYFNVINMVLIYFNVVNMVSHCFARQKSSQVFIEDEDEWWERLQEEAAKPEEVGV